MHVHILGICGTFMGSLAIIAKQLGHRVSGSDANVYPPMSTQLEEMGIDVEPRIVIEEVNTPSEREGGVMVADVDELIDKLKNEAKVL